ncbi:MAG TPA: type IX secretion system membrane protein PorP/SprF [Bacteroidia bacterium]|nr:type IX secretion system membrane protein PorP/SprF [Bacteroidia bacterium]
MKSKFWTKLSWIAGVLFMSFTSLQAQDIAFSQFYANPLYLNPAFAGTAKCPRFVMHYRNEWPALYKTFISGSVSYDQHVAPISGGIGILVTQDNAGDGSLKTTNASGIYSYQLNINRKLSLKAGIQATYFQKRLDFDKLRFGDQINDRSGFIYPTQEQADRTSRSGVDFSAGVLGYSKKYFFGFAAHHINQPDESFVKGPSRLPMKLTGHVGAVIPLNEDAEMSVSPNILYQKQANFQQLNLGVYLKKSVFVIGFWYRNKDAFIALAGIQTRYFKFGYSYDVTISKLNNSTGGSHEISLAFQTDCKPKKKKFRTISCPVF